MFIRDYRVILLRSNSTNMDTITETYININTGSGKVSLKYPSSTWKDDPIRHEVSMFLGYLNHIRGKKIFSPLLHANGIELRYAQVCYLPKLCH